MDKGWRVIFAFFGIFAAGAVTGGLLTLRFVPAPAAPPLFPQRPQAAPPPAPGQRTAVAPEQFTPQLFRRIANQLDLTPAQREKIRPIGDRGTEALQRLRRDSLYNTQVLIDKIQDEIRAQLTSDQQLKFDDFVTKQRERIRKFTLEQQQRQMEQRQQQKEQRRAGNSPAIPAAVVGDKK